MKPAYASSFPAVPYTPKAGERVRIGLGSHKYPTVGVFVEATDSVLRIQSDLEPWLVFEFVFSDVVAIAKYEPQELSSAEQKQKENNLMWHGRTMREQAKTARIVAARKKR